MSLANPPEPECWKGLGDEDKQGDGISDIYKHLVPTGKHRSVTASRGTALDASTPSCSVTGSISNHRIRSRSRQLPAPSSSPHRLPVDEGERKRPLQDSSWLRPDAKKARAEPRASGVRAFPANNPSATRNAPPPDPSTPTSSLSKPQAVNRPPERRHQATLTLATASDSAPAQSTFPAPSAPSSTPSARLEATITRHRTASNPPSVIPPPTVTLHDPKISWHHERSETFTQGAEAHGDTGTEGKQLSLAREYLKPEDASPVRAIQKIRNRFERHQTLLRAAEMSNQKMREELSASVARVRELSSQLAAVTSTSQTYVGLTSDLERRNEIMRKQVASHEHTIASYKQTITTDEENVAGYEKTIIRHQSAIARHQNTIASQAPPFFAAVQPALPGEIMLDEFDLRVARLACSASDQMASENVTTDPKHEALRDQQAIAAHTVEVEAKAAAPAEARTSNDAELKTLGQRETAFQSELAEVKLELRSYHLRYMWSLPSVAKAMVYLLDHDLAFESVEVTAILDDADAVVRGEVHEMARIGMPAVAVARPVFYQSASLARHTLTAVLIRSLPVLVASPGTARSMPFGSV